MQEEVGDGHLSLSMARPPAPISRVRGLCPPLTLAGGVGRSRDPARLIKRPLPALLTLLLSPVAAAATSCPSLSRHAQSTSDE